jgi:tetratricopeptide (TPR) repeat protein
MNKDQLQFLVSGILFGFLVGFLIAYAVYEPRVVQEAAPVPAAGNMGMSGSGEGPSAPPAAPAGGGPGDAAQGSEQTMNRVFEELKALKSSLDKNPKDTVALLRLANLYHDVGKYKEAVDYYKRALEVTPTDADARTDMGSCLREMGMADEAIAQFRTSLSYSPKHWPSWFNLAIVFLFDKKDLPAATAAIAKVEELNPTLKELPLLKDALHKMKSGAPAGSS